MKLWQDTLKLVDRNFPRPQKVLEVGTIRNTAEGTNSTVVAGTILEGHGELISVDINAGALALAERLCVQAGIECVEFVHADSLQYLRTLAFSRRFNLFHAVLLDGENRALRCLGEFLEVLPLMVPGGYIFVDDAGINPDGAPDGTPNVKGVAIHAALVAMKLEFEILEGPRCHQLRIPCTIRMIETLSDQMVRRERLRR